MRNMKVFWSPSKASCNLSVVLQYRCHLSSVLQLHLSCYCHVAALCQLEVWSHADAEVRLSIVLCSYHCYALISASVFSSDGKKAATATCGSDVMTSICLDCVIYVASNLRRWVESLDLGWKVRSNFCLRPPNTWECSHYEACLEPQGNSFLEAQHKAWILKKTEVAV